MTTETDRAAGPPDPAGFVATAGYGDLWDGEMETWDADGVDVLLVKVEGRYLAYAGACPHQGRPLAEGDLDGTTLTCGAHLWEFDVVTGRGINPRGACLVRHDVRIAGDQVYVSRRPSGEEGPS